MKQHLNINFTVDRKLLKYLDGSHFCKKIKTGNISASNIVGQKSSK